MRRAGPPVGTKGLAAAGVGPSPELVRVPPPRPPTPAEPEPQLAPTSRPATHHRPPAALLEVGAPLLALMAGALALGVADLGSWLWMDEGISVGIASHPLSRIPGLLRGDGSPPLYYVLLHGWMRLFGTSEVATHSLSLVISLASVPIALWAGWSLFGRRAGWTFAALMAFSPYLANFASETRMYALVTLLSLVATASFLHAFVFGRRRYLLPFAASLALVLYTHNWGLWLAGGAVVAVVPCALAAADRRRILRDAGIAFGAVAGAYLPWLPTLLYQAAHTGAPWSPRPSPREAVTVVDSVLGDPHERVLVALALVAGPALWAVLRRHAGERAGLAALVALGAVPVGLGWVAAQFSPSWVPRYLAVCTPAILLLAAVGLARAGGRGLLALALILVVWIQPFARLSGLRPAGGPADRAAVQPLARAVAQDLHPGDLVVAMQLEEVPVLAYYLPKDLRFANALGPVADPTVADWRDALDRMKAATAATALQPELDRAPVGTRVLLVCADPSSGPRSLPWFALMDQHCDDWRAALQADPRFTAVAEGSGLRSSPDYRQVLAFTKTGA